MRIAVIADTHNKFPDSVAGSIREADEIWHLGDMMNPDLLEEIRALGPPVLVVRGNNDDCMEWPLVLDLTRKGHTFRLVHIPPKRLPETEFLLHGHTHVPRDEQIGGVRVLNPGTIGKPNKGAPPSYGWLEFDSLTGGVSWTIVRI
jgi:putative phosphoesterase